MEKNKKTVIIIDGASLMLETAEKIAAEIGEFSGYSAMVIQAESFSGVDLLPASAFFLGCEEANEPSFAYIEDLLGHINLAGRPCGIFSSSARTLKYLSGLVHDSECSLGKPFQVEAGAADREKLHNWLESILVPSNS